MTYDDGSVISAKAKRCYLTNDYAVKIGHICTDMEECVLCEDAPNYSGS